MATAAAYHKPQPALTLEVQLEQNPRPTTVTQLCRDLEDLCAAGFLEASVDQANVVRYKPVLFGRAKRTA